MNSMKKRIIAMLVICISILSLAACGADPKTIDYNGKSYDELEENAVSTWESIQSLDMAQLEMIVEQIDSLSEAEQIAFFDANEGASEQLALFRSWISVSKEVGDYVGVDSFSVTKSGKSTTTELILEFEKRILNFIEEIKEKYKDKSILIVAHGGVAKVLKAYLYGKPKSNNLDEVKMGNCEIIEAEL